MAFTINNKLGHKTRKGAAARILATDLAGPRPIIAAVRRCDGSEQAFSYDLAGQHLTSEDFDLIDIEPKIETKFCNLYQEKGSSCVRSGLIVYNTAVEARQMQIPEPMSLEVYLGTFAARFVEGELVALTKVMPEDSK